MAGAAPVRDAEDVLVALGLDSAANGRGIRDAEPVPADPGQARVLAALQQAPATIEQLAQRLEREVGIIAVQLARLELAGLVTACGGWWEVTGAAPGPRGPGRGSVP